MWAQKEIRRRRNRGVALPVAQALACLVKGNESRGARGIEDQRRAAEIQEIAQPCGQHSIVLPGQLAGAEAAAQLQQCVVALLCSHEHAHPGAAQLLRSEACVLQRVPCFLQQQPLTRVHSGGLAG